jgi:hypothetical protein
MYLVLVFGAALSWPLFIVPTLLIAGFVLLPAKATAREFLKYVWSLDFLPVTLGILLQLVPVYFQLAYSGQGTSQGINLSGGLQTFHALVPLAGILVVGAFILKKDVDEPFRRMLLSIFLPFTFFIGLLVVMQYFLLGEIRYYVIKSSFLLELLLLTFAMAAFVYSAVKHTFIVGNRYFIFLPLIPFTIMLLLVSTVTNPLKEIRDLFRGHSSVPQSQYFSSDISIYDRLGSSNKIINFNITTLHYNPDQGKFFGNMEIAFWATMMHYNVDQKPYSGACTGTLYTNLAYGTFTAGEQHALVELIKTCAQIANKRGEPYYIVTDPASVPYVQQAVGGEGVEIVAK